MKQLRQPRPKHVLPLISFVTFLGFLDTHLLIPVMSLYATELGAGLGIAGLIIGLYSITNTPANILFGRIVDRIGYKRPLVAGLLGDALGMFLYSVCRLPLHLALVRILHGITGGLVGPSSMSAMAQHGGDTGKGRAMAFYGISLAAATLVGYGVSGFIASRQGYDTVFWLGAILLVVGAAMGLLLPKSRAEPLPGRRTSFREGWRHTRELMGRHGLTGAYVAIFAQYFSFGGVVTLLPLYVKGLGMEAFHVGMLLAAFAVVFIIVQIPVGIISDRIGRRGPTSFGLSLGFVALLLLPSVGSFAPLLAAMALYGVAYGAIFPSVSAMVADATSSEERGLGTGIFHALLTAGVAIGAPVIGWTGQAAGVKTGLFCSAAIMAVALVVTLAVTRRRN